MAALGRRAHATKPRLHRCEHTRAISLNRLLDQDVPSDARPMTRPASSTTGNALIRRLGSIAAISLNDASFLTATTEVVMTSLAVALMLTTSRRRYCLQHGAAGPRPVRHRVTTSRCRARAGTDYDPCGADLRP
jgi:hypothetical protein